jgi:Phosphotransferase enzyme family
MNVLMQRNEINLMGSDVALGRLEAVLDLNRLRLMLKAAVNTMGDHLVFTSCSIERVHLQGDGGFVVEVAADIADGSTRQYLVEVPAGDFSQHLDNIKRRTSRQNARTGRAEQGVVLPIHADDHLGVFVRPRGFDELIHGLVTQTNIDLLRDQLAPEVAANVVGSGPARLLAHRLHRRAVVGIGDRYILKLYKRLSTKAQQVTAFTTLLERTSFGEGSTIRVPKTFAHLKTWPGYLMLRSEGVPLSVLQGEKRTQGMRLAGEAIGHLHRLPLRLQVSHSQFDECALLWPWVKLISSLYPALSRDVVKAYNHVVKLLTHGDAEPFTLVHRDFHESQVLISGKTATLIDFDTACNGEPAQDLGNFLGHLDFAALAESIDGEAAASEFLTGYTLAHVKPNATRVDAHRRATLLRMACIYAFSTNHSRLSPLLVAMALRDYT